MENRTAEAIETLARQVSAVLRDAARRLTSKGIGSGPLDAEVLLAHALGARREELLVAGHASLNDAQLRAYERLLSRRLAREPTAYITGKREFWSLDIHVAPDVLIPRPETEFLVEIALAMAAQLRCNERIKILDLGTGSGAIAIALAAELPGARIVATDISAAALAVARGNALRSAVASRIRFVESDLFESLDAAERFDLMVSNPPYICRPEIDTLEPEVRRWEPRGALDGGVDGLDFYRRIAAQVFGHLEADGVVAVEIGAGMGAAVAPFFQERFDCGAVEVRKDYAGNERVVVARKAPRS